MRVVARDRFYPQELAAAVIDLASRLERARTQAINFRDLSRTSRKVPFTAILEVLDRQPSADPDNA